MESFTREVESTKPPSAVFRELLSELTEPLSNWGYELETQSEAAITYGWTYRRWYVWVLVVILFPLGLLFLFVKDKAPITITLEPSNGGTRVRVRGEGPAKVQAAFESMEI